MTPTIAVSQTTTSVVAPLARSLAESHRGDNAKNVDQSTDAAATSASAAKRQAVDNA